MFCAHVLSKISIFGPHPPSKTQRICIDLKKHILLKKTRISSLTGKNITPVTSTNAQLILAKKLQMGEGGGYVFIQLLIPYECPCICRYRASHVLLCSKFYSMLRTTSCSTNPVNTIHNDVISNRAVTFYRNIVESKLEGSFRHCVFVCTLTLHGLWYIRLCALSPK